MTTKSVTMPVTGMSLVSCAHNIERTVGKLPGVGEVNVNFAAEQAVISFDSEQLDIQNLVAGIKGGEYNGRTNRNSSSFFRQWNGGSGHRSQKRLRWVRALARVPVVSDQRQDGCHGAESRRRRAG